VISGKKGVEFVWGMSEQEKEAACTLQNKRLEDVTEMWQEIVIF
jgi:hypothetical protein